MARGLLGSPPIAPLVWSTAASYGQAAKLNLIDALNAAVEDATTRTAKTVLAFAQAARNGIDGIEAELVKAHREIAQQAQAAVVEAYQSSLLGSPDYRTSPRHARNKRYAGGALLSAIQDSGFAAYDAHGVYLGNRERLDAAARQWRRLNYGAGGAAGGEGETFTVLLSNLSLHMQEPGGPRPGFVLPGGRWVGQEFYPFSELPDSLRKRRSSARGRFVRSSTPTRGIRGTHWLAAGIEVIAEQMGTQYNNVFRTLWLKADEEAKQALTGSSGLHRLGAIHGHIAE